MVSYILFCCCALNNEMNQSASVMTAGCTSCCIQTAADAGSASKMSWMLPRVSRGGGGAKTEWGREEKEGQSRVFSVDR